VRGREETAKETVAYWGYRTVEWLAMTLPEKRGRRSSRRSAGSPTAGCPT
jgi:hypothetical protein